MLASLSLVLSAISESLTPTYLSNMARERTFIAIKPDGVQRGLIGDIIKRFESKGFKLAGMKFIQASQEHLEKHYADLSKLPFFPGLVKYMASGPLLAMCWEGTGVVKTARKMMGATKPADSEPGTIRGDFCIEVGRNIIHGSDSVEAAEKELALWFKPEELVSWTQSTDPWIYEYQYDFYEQNQLKRFAKLNEVLRDHSYIRGFTISDVDIVIFHSITEIPHQQDFPHLCRWIRHIKSYIQDVHVHFHIEEKETIPALPQKNTCSLSIKEQRSLEEKETDEEISTPPVPASAYAALLNIKLKETVGNKVIEELIKGISMKGLQWGASKYTCNNRAHKMSILCTIRSNDISIHDVILKLIKHEDYIINVDIGTFYMIKN